MWFIYIKMMGRVFCKNTKGSILGPNLFLQFINDLTDDAICNIVIYANDASFCSKCDQVSDLWQQQTLASEFESELRDTKSRRRKRLVDFNTEKTRLVRLTSVITLSLLM